MDSIGTRYKSLISNDDEDTYDNHQDTANWHDDDDEVELESDEHELFLRDEHLKQHSNNELPYKATILNMSQAHIRNGLSKLAGYPRKIGHNSNSSTLVNHSGNDNARVEAFQLEDSGIGSSRPSSVAYQVPNYDQFAGNLAPTSPKSVLVSFVVIFVILAVTIVPNIIPKTQLFGEDLADEDSSDSSTKIAQLSNEQIHLDVRCKCICPPLVTTFKSDTNSSTTAKNSDQRRLYVGNTSPAQCNCNNIVQPHYKEESGKSLREFCSSCECRYQSRNITTIRRNVIFFIAVLIGLSLYLLVQYILRYLRITRRGLPPNLRWLSHQMNESN
jgi:hypothetical protein